MEEDKMNKIEKDSFLGEKVPEVEPRKVEAQMEMVLSQYKSKEKKALFPISKIVVFFVAFILLGGMVWVILWMNKNLDFLSELPSVEQEEEEATSSSGRKVDWSDLEAEVQKKRLEADIEFEKKKEEVENGSETEGTEEENSETSNSTVDASSESTSLEGIKGVINVLDQEEISSPEDYDF